MSERQLIIKELQENKEWLNDFIFSFNEKYFLIADGLKKRGLDTTTDAIKYYTYINCPSFAYILNKVFDGQTEVYTDLTNKQVISKIGNDFYNITGCITDKVQNHRLYGKDEFGLNNDCEYIEYLNKKIGHVDATDKFMTNSLIKLGNLYIDEKIENTKTR